MSRNARLSTCAGGGDHTWETIGETSYSGDTWGQIAHVQYCARCDRYAAKTHVFLDFRRRPESVVQQMVSEETAERKALIDEHKAMVRRHRATVGEGT